MKEAPSGQSPYLVSDPVSSAQDSAFDALERTLRHSGPPGAFEQLIEHLDKAGDYRSLRDALLLKARYDLNPPREDMVYFLAARLQEPPAAQARAPRSASAGP